MSESLPPEPQLYVLSQWAYDLYQDLLKPGGKRTGRP